MAATTSGPNITVSQQTLNEIAELVGDRTAEELKAIGDDGSLLMKKYALDFVNTIKQSRQEIVQLEQMALSLKNKRHSLQNAKNGVKSPAEVQSYIEAREKFKQQRLASDNLDKFYQASMLFNERILQIITGHKTRISIVVPSSDDAPVILDVPMEDLFEGNTGISIVTDMTSGKIPRLSGRIKIDIDKIKQNLSQAIRTDSIIGAQSLKGLNQAYEVTQEDYRKWKPHVFWKVETENIWYKLTVGGAAGDLAEAYAYFFYTGGGEGNNPNTLFLGKIYNRNMDYFIREGVANVDNISGLYASDVTTNEYDYAVKSLNASLPGYTQMVTLANKILNNKIKNASQLKKVSLQKQYKDIVKMSGRKGLRNTITEAVASQIPTEIRTTVQVG